MNRLKVTGLVTMGAGVPVLGLLLLGTGDCRAWIRKGEQAKLWPTTQAAVIECGEAPTRTHFHKPAVLCQYTVGGVEYRSDQTFFGVGFLDESEAKRYLERYAPGTAASVYYDPEHPACAVLEPGTPGHTEQMLSEGVAFAWVSGSMIFFGGAVLLFVGFDRERPE